MYGQYDRRRQREVRLVRVNPNGNGLGRGRRGRRRRMQSRAVLLAFSLFLIITCMGAMFYVVNMDAQESLSEGETDTSMVVKQGERGDVKIPGREEAVPTAIPKEAILVAIDPGHGGVDGGSDRDGVLEKEVNLEIANRLKDKLEELGFEVMMIREDNDTFINKQDRADKANQAGADAYISIHQNTYEEYDNEVSGIETYYCGDTDGSQEFAQLIHNGVITATGARDRELRETDGLYVVREAKMPSCLVEASYLTNKKEREAIVTPEYQDKLASGMAEGIYHYFFGEEP
ncbi:MAG: N-acetylmuramoyl-L-alanine amidase [Lachnospiraceae bacterium]|nr:N-acetylmuramoyl-L-alanine amidase [Lachnospiraceae bacterium]